MSATAGDGRTAEQCGLFVVVVGPRGVGTSTVCTALAHLWQARGETVHAVMESATPVGRLLPSSEATLRSRARALSMAAGRYAYLADEVVPALERGAVVLSDGYVPSSLVLERLDGLSVAEIWSYNRFVRRPDVSIYLGEAAEVIAARRSSLQQLSRLEAIRTAERELRLHRDAHYFLGARGWTQIVIKGREQAADKMAKRIAARVAAVRTGISAGQFS